MAKTGTAFFDQKGQFFRNAEDATISDLADLLGRVGDGESLAPGIAKILFEKRDEINRIFADHDEMMRKTGDNEAGAEWPVIVDTSGKIASIRSAS